MRDNSEKKRNTGLLFFMRNPYMKFQDSSFNGLSYSRYKKCDPHSCAKRVGGKVIRFFKNHTWLLQPRLDLHRSGGAFPRPPNNSGSMQVTIVHVTPQFLDRGFKFRKGGLFSLFCLIFSKITHENEII